MRKSFVFNICDVMVRFPSPAPILGFTSRLSGFGRKEIWKSIEQSRGGTDPKVMPARFVTLDRQTPMFVPCDLRDWLPADYIVHFMLDAVEQLPLNHFHVNARGTGSEQYPPAMILALLIYCYATGRFGARTIEAATFSDVAACLICANQRPDHAREMFQHDAGFGYGQFAGGQSGQHGEGFGNRRNGRPRARGTSRGWNGSGPGHDHCHAARLHKPARD